jgi:hypothetical protein
LSGGRGRWNLKGKSTLLGTGDNEVINGALGGFDSEEAPKKSSDLAVGVTPASKFSNEFPVGFELRASGLFGGIVK